MDSARGRALTVVVAIVVTVVILVSLSLILVYLTQSNGMSDESCWPSPIGIVVGGGFNHTTGDDFRSATIVSVRPWCFSNRLEDVIARIRAPDNAILENRTIQQIAAAGSAFVAYHDVTPPATTLDVHDYFEFPVSASPPGTQFDLREMSSGSLLYWMTFS